MEKLHERLRSELEAKGLSAAQAARDAGEPDSQGLRDVLAGRKRLSAELLSALVVGTGIDGGYVLTGKTLPERVSDAAAGLPGRLRALRETHGLDSVLHVSGLTAKQWQSYESSKVAPKLPPGTLQRLIDGYILDAMQLLTGQSEAATTDCVEETVLLKNYRACPPLDQEAVRHQTAFLASRAQASPSLAADGRYPQREEAHPMAVHDKSRKKGV